MNLVFMNSLEKSTGEQVLNGQISISEQQGRWQVFWNEQEPDGKIKQEDWYEGTGWEEMMRIFRYRISEKLSEGFLPILEGVTDHFEIPKGREEAQQMIICYGEMNRNDKLYEELREWRRKVAFQDNKAAYFIATNRVLGLISAYVPKTKEELLQIPGFGAHRLEHYGDGILKITEKYEQAASFPLDWVPDQLDRRQFTLWYYRQKQVKIRKETDQFEIRKGLLAKIEEGATLAVLSEKFELSLRETVQWIEQLESEGYDLDGLLNSEMEQMPESLREPALQAFAKLGDRYLKPVLQHIYGEQIPEELDLTQVYAWLRILRIHYRRLQDSMAAV